MSPRFAILLPFCLLIAGRAAPAAAQGSAAADRSATPDDGPHTQIVLLANGSLLRGRVIRSDDGLTIVDPRGSRARLSESQVERVFDSLREMLDYRLQSLRPSDTSGRFRLAHWCLRQRDLEGAQRIYDELQHQRPGDVRLNALSTQIATLRRDGTRERNVRGGVIAVRSQRPTAQPERIDPAVRHAFQHRIEPILLKNCAQSGCHGPGGAFTYRLIRPFGKQRPTLSQTRFNLDRTLKKINALTPAESLLLHYATKPHGRSANPIGASDPAPISEETMKQLRSWVFRAAGHAEDSATRPTRPGQLFLAQQEPAVSPTGGATPLPEKRSSDPYDPALFNAMRARRSTIRPRSR